MFRIEGAQKIKKQEVIATHLIKRHCSCLKEEEAVVVDEKGMVVVVFGVEIKKFIMVLVGVHLDGGDGDKEDGMQDGHAPDD